MLYDSTLHVRLKIGEEEAKNTENVALVSRDTSPTHTHKYCVTIKLGGREAEARSIRFLVVDTPSGSNTEETNKVPHIP